MASHRLGELVQRRERGTQQDQIGGEQGHQPGGQDHQLARRDRHGHGDRCEYQTGEGEEQDARVGGEYAPEQRKRGHPPTHA
jgi:hypothetical protein